MPNESQNELISRLNLMEEIIQEGRRTTSFYGWMFVLWGVGYAAAIAAAYLVPRPNFAWPVVMVLTAVAGGVIGSRKRRGQPDTVKSRALGAIWISTSATIFILAFGCAASPYGWSHPHPMMAGIELLTGLANMASSLTLRWKVQAAVAILWWACGVASFYVSSGMLLPVLSVGIVFGNLGFGIYLMVLESRARRSNGGLATQVAHG